MLVQIRRTFQYLYYLRFSLLLWLFPVAFAFLDSGWLSLNTTTLSRGIFVPEYWSGYLCVAFFVITTGCVALITARTVVLNGIARYPDAPPPCVDPLLDSYDAACAKQNRDLNQPPKWLSNLLAGPNPSAETWSCLIALIPSLLTFLYLIIDSTFEGVTLCNIGWGLLAGSIMALSFWGSVNAWYYLAYQPPYAPAPGDLLALGVNAARTILFPRWCFCLRYPGPGVVVAHPPSLEDITTTLRDGWLAVKLRAAVEWAATRFGLPGYVYDTGQLFEAQLFGIIAAAGFVGLFWLLYPLTAPHFTPVSLLALVLLFGVLCWFLMIVASGYYPEARVMVRWWKIALSSLGSIFCLLIPTVWIFTSPDRFPTLASILLVVIVLGWVLSGAAFCLDRYRIPVLTSFLLAVLILRMVHLYDFGGFEEHYASTVQRDRNAAPLPTPAQILADRLEAQGGDDPRPLVIITATGGGLHASSWTTHVLRELYRQLPSDFPDHILLLSTVSGGSIGISYYLQEISNPPPSGKPDFDRIVVASQCSSLEAVGWGLVYYDFTRSLLPLAPFFVPPSLGDNDLDASPLGKDRTWSLRKGIERNAADFYCFDSAKKFPSGNGENLPPTTPGWAQKKPWYRRLFSDAHQPSKELAPGGFTLASLLPSPKFPAFTMNTTTVEAGDRFLLANYRLPAYRVGTIEGAPAESFLDLFCQNPRADLPLASAAQLSAAYPYVSSAARIPSVYASESVHFVDGGYYDNDGTSSAIEFLRYALQPPIQPLPSFIRPQDVNAQVRVAAALKTKSGGKLRVLLLEIRNSADTDAPDYPVRPRALNPQQRNPSRYWPAGMLQQLGFPLEGFYNAGHGSVTGRDRNGLDLLRDALGDRLELYQIIFDDDASVRSRFGIKTPQDPLSWSLTPRQRAEVRDSSKPSGCLERCYRAAGDWFDHFDCLWQHLAQKPPPPCRRKECSYRP